MLRAGLIFPASLTPADLAAQAATSVLATYRALCRLELIRLGIIKRPKLFGKPHPALKVTK
jgi:hypothetical protein